MREFDSHATDSMIRTFGTNRGLDLEAVSDACDALGVGRCVLGLAPVWQGAPAFAGPAVTMELVCDGFPVSSRYHLGVDAALTAVPGSVIVIDHRGRRDVAGWGGLLTRAAQRQDVRGVVIDGAARDAAEAAALGFPVYGTGPVSTTARGRIVQRSFNEPIDFRGVPVCPGDVVFAADGGVMVVAAPHVDEVLAAAAEFADRETGIADAINRGDDLRDVFGIRYEAMLESDAGS